MFIIKIHGTICLALLPIEVKKGTRRGGERRGGVNPLIIRINFFAIECKDYAKTEMGKKEMGG